MPIRAERVEPYIYRVYYSGKLTIDEMLSGTTEKLAQEHGETPYIGIMNAKDLREMPNDIRRLREMARIYSVEVTILVHAPVVMTVLANLVHRLTSAPIETAPSVKAALERARTYRDERILPLKPDE